MKREAVVKVRVNQGLFRETLLKRYNKCCLCGVSDEHFLVASHIKPWVVSESDEKLDPDNGFILCPNHDKAFDGGYITFADDGKIVISNGLTATDRMFLISPMVEPDKIATFLSTKDDFVKSSLFMLFFFCSIYALSKG